MRKSASIKRSGYLIVRLDQSVVDQIAQREQVPGSTRLRRLSAVARTLHLKDLSAVLRRYPGLRSFPAIGDEPITQHLNLEAWEQRAAAGPARSLASYFAIDARRLRPSQVESLLERLAGLAQQQLVDCAYRDPLVTHPGAGGDHPTDTEDDRKHLGPAPKGIGVDDPRVRAYTGSGVGFVDIEESWNLATAGLPRPKAKNLFYGSQNPHNDDHGTAVLGIVLGQTKGKRIVGIARGADFLGLASFYASNPAVRQQGLSMNVARAILAAIKHMTAGDVLLLEVSIDAYPVEITALCCDAIRFAVACGIVVIEPAGNLGDNLDQSASKEVRSLLGKRSLTRDERPEFLDSGAIMVSSCESRLDPTNAGAHRRDPEDANFGSRIDCFAWGEKVFTTGVYGGARKAPGGPFTFFGGTSAAAASIAGSALLIQEMATKLRGSRLSPAQVRLLLADPENGTPVLDPGSSEPIGFMPDLVRVLEKIPLLPDLFIRDSLQDTGVIPQPRSYQSPDIIVRNSPSPDAEAEFGEDSELANVAPPMDSILPDHDQYVYVRISSRQRVEVKHVSIKIYWGEGDGTTARGDWKEVGELKEVRVAANRALTIAGPLLWPSGHPAIESDHGSFVAVLNHELDPGPGLLPLPDLSVTKTPVAGGMGSFALANNNVAWRRSGLWQDPGA